MISFLKQLWLYDFGFQNLFNIFFDLVFILFLLRPVCLVFITFVILFIFSILLLLFIICRIFLGRFLVGFRFRNVLIVKNTHPANELKEFHIFKVLILVRMRGLVHHCHVRKHETLLDYVHGQRGIVGRPRLSLDSFDKILVFSVLGLV